MARRRRDGRRDNENLLFIAFSSSVIFDKMTAPSSEGAFVGQPQGLSLRYDIEFNFATAESSNIFANSFGRSKPLPYNIDI